MPIFKNGNGELIYEKRTDQHDGAILEGTGVEPAESFAVADESDPLKQVAFDPSTQVTNTRVVFKTQSATPGVDVVLTLPSVSSDLTGTVGLGALIGDVVTDPGTGTVNSTIQPGVVTGSKIASNTITNANINSAAAIQQNKLAALTANKALATDSSGIITTSSVTSTELGRLSGVTSAVQTQLNNKVDTSSVGSALGVASLDAGGKVPSSQLPSSVMEYQGTWNAATNTPKLANGTGSAGDVYVVTVAGSTNFGAGSISFAVGDWAVYSGSIWQKSLNSDAVSTVNGQVGTVVLTTTDIAEGTNQYFTTERAQDSVAASLTNTSSINFTYNDSLNQISANVNNLSITSGLIANSAVDLTTKVTGVLPLANGGTGQSTKAPAFDALQPMTSVGDLIVGGAAGTGTRLPIGSAAQVLTVTGGTPTWETVSAGSAITALTGDVTATGPGSASATIASNVVTNAKLAQMATATFKGRTTAGTGNAEDLTATQATALLNNMVGDSGSGGTKGLVPAPGTGDFAAGKYLNAGGTYTKPPGDLSALFSTQGANTFFAGPNTGSPVAPAFRTIVGADLPNPSASALGGVQSKAVISGQYLTGISTSGVPSSATPSFSDLTGTASIGQGGTGQTSKAAAFDALSPMTTSGDIIYGGASGTGTRLAKGTDGQIMVQASGIPSWTTVLPSASIGLGRTINSQTGTTYTFVLSDGSAAGANTLVTASNASAQTYTVPPNSSVAYPTGTQIDLVQLGAGKVTLAQGSGVTINSKASNKSISAQYVGVTLVKTATDTWLLLGDLIA